MDRQSWSELFIFNNAQRKGVKWLLGILIALVLLRFSVDYWPSDKDALLIADDTASVTLFLNRPDSASKRYFPKEKVKINYFIFDPNLVDRTQWISLGLKPYLADRIVKFREKGGKFYKPEDLKKIYGLSSNQYDELLPYIKIESQSRQFAPQPTSPVVNKLRIELNAADSIQLVQLKGIGPVKASRIIKYRNLLGGFYKTKQLLEVYSMDSLVVASLENKITINPSLIKKFNINQASFKELLHHPYIKEYALVKSIFQHKQKFGSFKNLEDLKSANILKPKQLEALVPYLSF